MAWHGMAWHCGIACFVHVLFMFSYHEESKEGTWQQLPWCWLWPRVRAIAMAAFVQEIRGWHFSL